MAIQHKPLISCLCVSAKRATNLKKAIHYFKNQTYRNRELIIVSSSFDNEYHSIVSEQKNSRIKYYWYEKSEQPTLGEMRNFSIQKSTGEYCCIWDDDDWYHKKRLEIQLEQMLINKKDGVILPYSLIFHLTKKKAYLSPPFMLAASIIFRKKATRNLKYSNVNIEEDISFIRQIYERNILYPLVKPSLYIYIFHGKNTGKLDHFERIFNDSYELPTKLSEIVFQVVSNEFSYSRSCLILDQRAFLKELDFIKASKII